MSPREKLLAAQEALHTANALLLLSEEKAFNLAETVHEHQLALGSVGRAIELSNKIVLDAVQLIDQAHCEIERARRDQCCP